MGFLEWPNVFFSRFDTYYIVPETKHEKIFLEGASLLTHYEINLSTSKELNQNHQFFSIQLCWRSHLVMDILLISIVWKLFKTFVHVISKVSTT
jgi:hypothetical protein